MSLTLLTATGYLSGGASDETPTTIRSVLVIPGTSAGSLKFESGVNGADTDLIPSHNATIPTPQVTNAGQFPFEIPLKRPVWSGKQCYVTISNCNLLIEHG